MTAAFYSPETHGGTSTTRAVTPGSSSTDSTKIELQRDDPWTASQRSKPTWFFSVTATPSPTTLVAPLRLRSALSKDRALASDEIAAVLRGRQRKRIAAGWFSSVRSVAAVAGFGGRVPEANP